MVVQYILRKQMLRAACVKRRRISTVSISLEDKKMSLESGKLARFADGCAVARIGDTAVMVTAVSRKNPSSGNAQFLPLTVDYRQKAAAGGRIPTNFLRRELGPSDHEILTSRIIDRSLRPLFPKGYGCETQVSCNLLSVDGVNDPDVLSINAASAALALSDIPWNGPLGAVRIGLNAKKEIIVNPTRRQLQECKLNLVLAGTVNEPDETGKKPTPKIIMIEMGADDIPLGDVQYCVKTGLNHVSEITSKIRDLRSVAGKPKRKFPVIPSAKNVSTNPQETPKISDFDKLQAKLRATTKTLAEAQIRAILTDFSHDKISRDQAITELKKDIVLKVAESAECDLPQGTYLDAMFGDVLKEIFRDLIFETGIRVDGRKFDDLRPVSCAVDLYRPLHGSALFQRGQTQVLCTVTFDSPDAAFRSDPMSVLTGAIKEKRFMLHYEFPQYAVNEIGGKLTGRRELGHGALAEKALRHSIPNDFPFTIRLTSEVLESNGSSSMATICGGSLALMDAGVQIPTPVAGVAVGLVTQTAENSDEITKWCVLTDISGMEDYMGDMDFKMGGSKRGLTAIQLDLKIPGIPMKILNDALDVATKSKKQLLGIMAETLEKPRASFKEDGPVSKEIEVPIHKRSRFMGLGGYNLKQLRANTGVQITGVDETKFRIFAPNRKALAEANEAIEKLLEDDKEPNLEFGAVYPAKIVELRDNGASVVLFPKMQPVLIPNSQLDQRIVGHPSALGLEVGMEISVKYFGRDPNTGHLRLSRKVLQTTLPKGTRTLLVERTRPGVAVSPLIKRNEEKTKENNVAN